MKLHEYLFIDDRRLLSYYQQISDTQTSTDKVNVWKSSLSITGPSAEVTQQRVARQPTPYEMIESICEHLRKNRMFESGPHNDFEAPFGEVTAQVWKAVVLANEQQDLSGRDYLSLWISEKIPEAVPSENIKFGRVYLLESCPEEDPTRVRGVSAFGALRFLLSLDETKQHMSSALHLPENQDLGLWPEFFPGEGDDHKSRAFLEFDRDPVAFFKSRGFITGDCRNITSVYRRRFSSYGSDYTSVEFGYPLFIAEGQKKRKMPN